MDYRETELATLKSLGIVGFGTYLKGRLQERKRLVRAGGQYTLRSRYSAHPLRCRAYTSDIDVFVQIFVEREYACVDDLVRPRLIVDCGANVGYSSAYFLSRFPEARLIAVEPDSHSFEVLRTNLAPFGDRAELLQAGVWSDTTGLRIAEEKYRDGREWTRQVRPCAADETPDVLAVDVGSLLERSGECRISILKMDVERAEVEIFARNYEGWIHRVDTILIELHDDECERVFFAAIKGIPFDITHSGELTVCRRRS